MAFIDFNLDINRGVIRFDSVVPDQFANGNEVVFFTVNANDYRISYRLSMTCYRLPAGQAFVLDINPEILIYMAANSANRARVGFLDGENIVCEESISLSANLINIGYDPLRLNCAREKLPEKPGRVAVFTQSFNEGNMLQYWEKYYASLVGYENLFVLNSGSTDDSCARLNPKTSVIHMPVTMLDTANFAQTQSYFARFLQQKYDWVVKTDVDEFLVCEGDFIDTLANTAPGVYAPEVALAIIHDYQNEARFSFDGKAMAQRKCYVHDHPIMKKPTITSDPVTWTHGNHMTIEKSGTIPGLWMVHLRWVCLDQLLNRNNRWAKLDQSAADLDICSAVSDWKGLDTQAIYELTVKELDGMLDKAQVEVPHWLTAKL
jgi:hypothetical protein